MGVRDLPRPSGPPTRVELTYRWGGPEPPRVPQARARAQVLHWKTRPPTAFNAGGGGVLCCRARGAAFDRPQCGPRIIEGHSAATCAAPAQSPCAALIGYDGTALFHHAGYAASYAARSATWQATPQATPGAVSTRQRLDMMNGGFQEQARKSRSMISFACNTIIYEQYVTVTASVGPTCRGPNGHVRASLEI